jgi:HK97 family phage portal protein
MANIIERTLHRFGFEKRSVEVVVPSRSATAATAKTALSLTPIQRGIDIIATPVSKMALETYRYAGGMEQRIENPLFVNSPSLVNTRREHFFMTVVDLALDGNSYWLKQFDTVGRVNSVQILPATSVLVEQDSFGTITYTYNRKKYSANEVEHLKKFSMAGELKGFSPIQLCKADVLAALELRDYAASWLTTSGTPTGVLKTNKDYTKAEADALTAAWHDKQAKRQVAVLSQIEYDTITPSPKDVLFTEVQALTTQNLARMFGIPARLLLTGVDGTSDTYSNLSDENQTFYRHTLMSYLDAIADAMSNCLPRGTSVRFNFESLFAADQETRYRMYSTALNGEAFATVEEIRKKEGLGL